MELDQQPSRAEQRMAAVAKLKRAASLPRMKDGRRPPMHTDAVSEGERALLADDAHIDENTLIEPDTVQGTGELDAEVVEAEAEIQVEVIPKPEREGEVEQAERAVFSELSVKTKRRSRSRSRSRGSKDLRNKVRAAQTPTPSSQTAGDSSQDEGLRPSPLNIASLAPLMSPIPSHLLEMQRSRLLRSPTPTSAESPALWNNSPFSQSPVLLPTLEAWQKGLLRSNSAGGSNAAGRMMAMHKLTGGTESYDPSGPTSTSPPTGKLSRNNTVTGGERVAARQLMLTRLNGRIGKEAEGDQVSGEERSGPSSTAKRRRRRSRRSSQSASATAGASDSEFLSTSPNTPSVPAASLPTFDVLPDSLLRSRSATPFQSSNLPTRTTEPSEPLRTAETPPETERPEPLRRRSVVIEDDEEEPYPLRTTYSTFPNAPDHTIIAAHLPHKSDAPFNDSSNSPSLLEPTYSSEHITQKTTPRHDAILRNPYITPQTVTFRDDDEEQVLYQPDVYNTRTLYEENYEREISWVAEPVPELEPRMPIHDEEDDEELDDRVDEYRDGDTPISPRSSDGFSPPEHEAYDDISPRVSSSSKSLIVESDNSTAASPSHLSLAPSAAAPSQSASVTRTSDDSTSSPTYPMRLSVASRSPLYGEFPDWDERSGNTDHNAKRTGDSPSAWDKVLGVLSRGSSTGRRSRSNSIVNRERRDRADSFNRESGASLNSAKNDRLDTLAQPPQSPLNVMQSTSASASISSLAPHAASRGGPSPIPPLTPGNKSKYQHAKLFPFGMTAAPEEQRARIPSASASSPDIIMQSSSNEEDLSHLSGGNPPLQSPFTNGERKLSHQTSDPHLTAKFNLVSPTSNQDTLPRSSHNGSTPKLPMTLPGVKQWLSKNKKKFTSTPSSPPSTTLVPQVRPLPPNKKTPVPDVIQQMGSEHLSTDWEDTVNTPTNSTVDTLLRLPRTNEMRDIPPNPTPLVPRPEITDTEKTPKATKKAMTMPTVGKSHQGVSFFDDSPLSPPSRPDPFSSATPDPSSSLSDYPAHSTSESSSTSSSRYSLGPLGPQGPIFIEKIDEELARGSRGRIWATCIDDPPRKLLLATPVLQVVKYDTVKDRFLFLFSDILIIAKPVFMDQEAYVEKSPIGRKFIVKSAIMLNQMRFTDGRQELDAKETNGLKARNRLLGTFVNNFSKDPDSAIKALYARSGREEDPVAVGQLLFKTLDLDRVSLGDYLARRTSKTALKVFLDSFGFVGLRIDKALRVFLLSIHIPERTHHHNGLEYLLEAFAGRWYEGNTKLVDYNKDHAHRFVHAIVQLNNHLHGGIAQEHGPTNSLDRDINSDEFTEAFRKYDQKSSVSDGLLRDVYESILNEKLSQSPSTSTSVETIAIKRAIPTSLTWRIESEPVVLRIVHVDHGLNIELYGQDLVFDPPVLNFGKSPEVSFRIKGTSLGPKSIIMRRSGPNALRYTGLPLSTPVLVERAFMRHTMQVAFENHRGLKRRYMFSMDDSVLRYQWAAHIRRQMELAAGASRLESTKFKRAADNVAFKILQETLTGSSPVFNLPAPGISQRGHICPINLNDSSRSCQGVNSINDFQFPPLHIRSKSRSKVYHRHGAGRDELDLSQTRKARDDDDKADTERNEGPLWSTEELKMLCEQNSTISSLLSCLRNSSVGPADAVSFQSPVRSSF